jgi:hypothetical protein
MEDHRQLPVPAKPPTPGIVAHSGASGGSGIFSTPTSPPLAFGCSRGFVFPSQRSLSTIEFHPEVTLKTLDSRTRRWTVIASGLLCGALAMVVLFTNRGAFFSPLAVVVMGAVGLVAVLLQFRLQNGDQPQSASSPAWLNILGILLALAAFFGDLLHIPPPLTKSLALGAVASFGISGVIILRSFRKRLAPK